MKRLGILSPAAFVLLEVSVLLAQPSIPMITDARAEGDTFRMEFTGPSDPPCVVQAADTLSGTWVDVPLPGQPPGGPVLVMIDRPKRYFRIRCDTIYSGNAAGYLKVGVPQRYSMIANHFNRGGNTLAELLPNPLEGTLLFKFDPVLQRFRDSQFEFGSWSRPDETLSPGEGAIILLNPGTPGMQLTWGGIVPASADLPPLQGQWNMVSFPRAEGGIVQSPLEGDTISQFDATLIAQRYVTRTFQLGEWSTEPSFAGGESFWYFRNAPNPTAQPAQGAVYFANRITGTLDARFWDNYTCPFEGTNWWTQLSFGTSAGSLVAAGDPLNFRTGPGAGYFDTRPGAVRYLPGIAPRSTVFLQVRIWQAPARTFEEAIFSGSPYGLSSIFSVPAGEGSPPGAPPALSGLVPFSLFLQLITSHPANQVGFVGSTARFKVGIGYPGPNPVTFQWQKATNGTNWVDIAGANSAELAIAPVTQDAAGSYRVFADAGCPSQFSTPATLTVIAAPRFSNLELNSSNGTFHFMLSAPAGRDYRVDVSTTLTNWAPFAILSNFTGQAEVSDLNAGQTSQQFYRVSPLNP